MFKIVDIHLSETACGEYVVLQNQGITTLSLRGWVLCSDAYLEGDPQSAAREMYIFTDDVPIKPYTRVVLFTGSGEAGWHPTVDGKAAYLLYWNRPTPLWSRAEHLHLLHLAATRKIVAPVEAVGAVV